MRAFILGNSGELLDHDLSRLKGEAVFGVNALPLRHPDIITHYVCADIGMAFVPEVRELVPASVKKYYSRIMWNTIDHEDGVTVYDVFSDSLVGFNPSVNKVYLCRTVTYAAMQIAVGLGYDELYLLGIDLGTPTNGINHIPEQAILADLIKSKNLRVPSVDKGQRDMTHDEMAHYSNKCFLLARHELDKLGVKVFNLSSGGNLKAFPRKSFNEVLSHHEAETVSDVELITKE